MFAAERLVPEKAIDLRICALARQLLELKADLARRTIRDAGVLAAYLGERGHRAEAVQVERILNEVRHAEAAFEAAYADRVQILTAFNAF